jgi:hypothetical protein
MSNSEKHTVSELIQNAAEQLRADCDNIRRTNPHYGEQGEEVEEIVKKFLNDYMPKRFRAGSGFVLDAENQMSRQCDVIVYDQLLSPIYRPSDRTQILPNHHVASVIEVTCPPWLCQCQSWV